MGDNKFSRPFLSGFMAVLPTDASLCS